MGTNEEGSFIVVTDEGVLSSIQNADEMVTKLLYAFLRIWDRDKGSIDVMEAAYKIIDMLQSMHEKYSETDFENIMKKVSGKGDSECKFAN